LFSAAPVPDWSCLVQIRLERQAEHQHLLILGTIVLGVGTAIYLDSLRISTHADFWHSGQHHRP
jgi:hypothetical protein